MKDLARFPSPQKLLCAAAAALAIAWAPSAAAEANAAYPQRPVRVVVPYSAGGNTDIIAREVMRRVADKLGQPFVVDNKPGGNSIIGTDIVAKAAPDGYSLLIVIGAYANNFALYKKLPFAPTDLAPVTQLTKTSLVLVTARPAAGAPRQLASLGNDSAAPLTYASSGMGSAAHILSERFVRAAGMTATQHVPYKGTTDAVSDLLSDRVGFMFDAVSAMGPHIKSGKLKALAVTGENRSPVLPDIPTMREAGYPDMVAYAWAGLLAPAKTPQPIVERLAATTAEVLKDPELVKKLASISTEPVGSTPAQFGQFIRSESESNGKLIQSLGVSLD